jgi:CheY-like chemotaxis protein
MRGKPRAQANARHGEWMTDDLISLKMLLVSEAAAERGLIRRAALQAAIPIECTEIEATQDAAAASAALEHNAFDVVFFDSRMPKSARQQVLNAIRASPGRSLAILVGAAEMRSREVLTDGLPVDGVLAKPLAAQEVDDLIQCCIRARLPKRVLIVDDSSTVRAVIRKVLQASRFQLEAEEAAEGAAAIERARAQTFDFVFLDCQMPGIDGFATLRKFKVAHPTSKVVMMTGTRDARIEDRARAEGASDFLFKPFFANDVDGVLNRLFGLMRARWN